MSLSRNLSRNALAFLLNSSSACWIRALLLYYVLISRDVSVKDKGLIIGALGYLILPLDLIPDFIPVAGFADDAAALAAVLKMVASNVTPEIEARAKAKANELFHQH